MFQRRCDMSRQARPVGFSDSRIVVPVVITRVGPTSPEVEGDGEAQLLQILNRQQFSFNLVVPFRERLESAGFVLECVRNEGGREDSIGFRAVTHESGQL